MKKVACEVRTFSVVLDASELATKAAAGTHDAVVIHDLLAPGWLVAGIGVETLTAFNGNGSRAVSIGVPGTANAMVNGLDVKNAGIKSVSVTQYRATEPTPITATLTTVTDNPTAGELRITLELQHVMREN